MTAPQQEQQAPEPEFVRYVKDGSPDRLVYTPSDRVNAQWDGYREITSEQQAERDAQTQPQEQAPASAPAPQVPSTDVRASGGSLSTRVGSGGDTVTT